MDFFTFFSDVLKSLVNVLYDDQKEKVFQI